MEQRVIINLGEGNWHQGFPPVIVQLWELGSTVPMQFVGQLPADVKLACLYEQWRTYYQAINTSLGLRQSPQATATIEIEPSDITHISTAEFESLCQELSDRFNAWLSVDSFVNVEKQLHDHLNKLEPVQFVITAQDTSVRRFPWHLWHFLDNCQQAEAAIGSVEYKKVNEINRQGRSQVRILSILGDSTGIKVEEDRKTLSKLANTDTVVLDERSRAEINEALWDEQGWDILCFSGHSTSYSAGSIGEIQINPSESLSMNQLKYALRTAIKKGLQLAIFNSCDGMGLATELAELDIPYLVVMREPVPDQVAQLFLMNFLKSLSAGTPFSLAVKESRERLQGVESTFFCASWLPVICQNPISNTFTWQSLQLGRNQVITRISPLSTPLGRLSALSLIQPQLKIKKLLMLGALLTTAVMGFRFSGFLEPLELKAYDHLMSARTIIPEDLRPAVSQDNRILLVEITENDINRYGGYPLKDRVLTDLINKVEEHSPAVIGLDLHRYTPRGNDSERKSFIEKFSSNKNLLTVCFYGASLNDFKIPKELSGEKKKQVGFSNVMPDPSPEVVRRQVLFTNPSNASPTEQCNHFGFGLLLADRYLVVNNIEPVRFSQTLKLGEFEVRSLSNRFAGYQSLGNQYQFMINYRPFNKNRRAFRKVSLSQIMEGSIGSSGIENTVVIIGSNTEESSLVNDVFQTPYGKMSGYEIHAHVVSQLLDTAMYGKTSVWGLPQWRFLQWGDMFWVFSWSACSSLILWKTRMVNRFILKVSFILAVQYVVCLWILSYGGWMPLVPAVLVISLLALVMSMPSIHCIYRQK